MNTVRFNMHQILPESLHFLPRSSVGCIAIAALGTFIFQNVYNKFKTEENKISKADMAYNTILVTAVTGCAVLISTVSFSAGVKKAKTVFNSIKAHMGRGHHRLIGAKVFYIFPRMKPVKDTVNIQV